jgi:hypothetical protein
MQYRIIGNVTHDGVALKKGSINDFSEDQAKELLSLGVIAELKSSEESEETETPEAPAVDEGDGLDGLSVKALKDLAKDEDVEIKGLNKKEDLIAAIRANREESEEPGDEEEKL